MIKRLGKSFSLFSSTTVEANTGIQRASTPRTIDGIDLSQAEQVSATSPFQINGWKPQQAVRWHPASFPLKVKIAPFGQLAQVFPDILKDWEAASEGMIQFLYNSPGTPDITVSWSNETTLGRDYEVGHAKRQVTSTGWIEHVDITLLQDPLIDKRLNPTQQFLRLRATILHEFGHALGLEHSTGKRDVMHYQGWRNFILSKQDIQALKTLYLNPRP